MFENMPQQLVNRLLAASHAIGVTEALQDLADDVAGWDADGCTTQEIDRRIKLWAKDTPFGYEAFLSEVFEPACEEVPAMSVLNPVKLWQAYGVEAWVIECARSIAFTDEPIPFLPLSIGYWIHLDDDEYPVVIGVMTPLSDPDLGARQLKDNFARYFGKKAARKTRSNEVENARMLAQHRNHMSYNDIAIQNLRDRYPDIIRRPHKYKTELKRERERVVKCVKAADELWKERLPESSTPE